MHGDFLSRVTAWAEARADVRAVVLIGSQARQETPADEWSDVDLMLLVTEPEPYLAARGWIEAFGEPLLTLVEPTAVGGQRERRVLYADGLDADFALMPVRALPALLASPEAAGVLARGYRVLVDKDGIADDLARVEPPPPRPLDADELDAVAADFWYMALLGARKLRRGEVWLAKQVCDGLLKADLVQPMAWRARAADPGLDTWHRGRFLERWADPASLTALAAAYARYEAADVARALAQTADLFARLESDCVRALGLARWPDREPVRRLLERALAGTQTQDR